MMVVVVMRAGLRRSGSGVTVVGHSFFGRVGGRRLVSFDLVKVLAPFRGFRVRVVVQHFGIYNFNEVHHTGLTVLLQQHLGHSHVVREVEVGFGKLGWRWKRTSRDYVLEIDPGDLEVVCVDHGRLRSQRRRWRNQNSGGQRRRSWLNVRVADVQEALFFWPFVDHGVGALYFAGRLFSELWVIIQVDQ